MPLTSCLDIEEDTSNFIAFTKKTIYLMSTLRGENNAEKSPAEQKKSEIKECEFGPQLAFFYSAFSKS